MADTKRDAEGALLPGGIEGAEGQSQEETERPSDLQETGQVPQHPVGEQLAMMAKQQKEMMALFSLQLQHLPGEVKGLLKKDMDALEARVTSYTDETYTRVKEEVKEELEVVKEEVKGEVRACLEKVATLEGVLAGRAASGKNLADPMEGCDRVQCWVAGASSLPAWQHGETRPSLTPPNSPPPSPPRSLSPALSAAACKDTLRDSMGNCRGVRSVELHPRVSCGAEGAGGGRKVIEYDGKVSWDAYQAQYEVIAFRQRWTGTEKAFHLVSALKGQALEVLEHLAPAQLQCYDSVAGALRRRFGRRRQPEVFRARLKTRRRGKDEPLPMLAQDVESLVRGAYPMASEDTVDMLAKDSFVDALQDRQLQIHVKQAAPNNVQEALARAAEFEAFLLTTNPAYPHTSNYTAGGRSHNSHARVRRVRAGGDAPQRSRKGTSTSFKGACWNCGQLGHRKSDCRVRARSQEDGKRMVFEPCCWSCGEKGHKSSECQHPKDVVTAPKQRGNASQLGLGAASQLTPTAPQYM